MNQRRDLIVAFIAIIASISQWYVLNFSILSPTLQNLPLIILVGCGFYFLVFRSQTEQKEQNLSVIKPKKTESAEQAYLYFAKRYGIGNRSIDVQWTISDDGSATLTRLIELEAYSTTNTIETYLAVPEEDNTGVQRDVDFGQLESLTNLRTVEITKIKSEARRLAASLMINPPLGSGDSVKYKMRERLPNGLYSIGLTKQQQLKRSDPKFDYSGWNINLPTKKVILKVYFPQNTQPQNYHAEVRYASTAGFPAKRIQTEETKRLNKPQLIGPEGDRYILLLEVDYPMIGLVYVLVWEPITIDNNHSETISVDD